MKTHARQSMLGLILAVLLTVSCMPQGAKQQKASLLPTAVPAEQSTPTAAATPAPTPTPASTAAPTPAPTAAPTPEPTPAPTPEPTETPVPAPTPFSIVWFGDTQYYSRHRPDVFLSMRDWVLKEREARNFVFFVHTGDVVDGCVQWMWDNATESLMPILDEIPGMIASGNHDIGGDERQSFFYNRPYAKAVQKEGQTYRKGEAAYTTFTAGGTEFLVFGMGYKVQGLGVVNWVKTVVDEHPEATILFLVHYGLQSNGLLTGQARELYQYIVESTPNARLLLCGHNVGMRLREDRIDDDGDGAGDRSFYTMQFNLQDDETDGLGYLRILTFDPADRHIEVSVYSPYFDLWEYPKASPEENHYILENAY